MARCTQVGDGPRGRRDHEPSSARRYALFLVVMAFMLSLLGQDCTISCNPPPPPSCLTPACTGVVVCDQFCATPRQVTQSCNYAFPCDPNDLRQCDTGLVCVANPKGTDGTCQPDTLLQPCSLLGLHCGSPEYCRESDLCGGTQSLCALPLQAGLPCSGLPEDPCTPCAPGLTCYAPPGSVGVGLPDPGTCVLQQANGTCSSNSQCNGCAGATCMSVVEDTASGGGLGLYTVGSGDLRFGGECFSCAQGVHSACSQQTPCCTPGQKCLFTDIPLTGSGTCCEAVGSPCPGGLSDCCSGITKCRPTSQGAANTCEMCAGEGAFCNEKGNADCCPGTTCTNGTCQCAGPGSKCSSKGDCCTDDVCVQSPIAGAGKFCDACPTFNSCKFDTDCCGGFQCETGSCCISTGSTVTCKTSSDCCSGNCDDTSHCQPPPCVSFNGGCNKVSLCCSGFSCRGDICCGLRGASFCQFNSDCCTGKCDFSHGTYGSCL
jgi:hypothetical protein